MPDPSDKPLISALHPEMVRTGSRPGQILSKLHGLRVAYRYWIGGGPRRELAGCGQFNVEYAGTELRCRVLGDLFKPDPFEFAFHHFWLTRRGMVMAVFDLAEDQPPAVRAPSETFLHFTNLKDHAIRREAAAFREGPGGGRKGKRT